ncbi:Target of rapamycin complex 1 subunit kog1, partial [Coemansia sp. RSA 25]
MANVASGNGDIPEYANGVAAVTLGPSLGNDGHPAIITTTATGANVELSELLGGSDLLDNGANRKPVSQTLMETREDFHTHPRSLALAHMQLADWRGQDKLRTVGSLLVVCLHLGIEPPDSVRPKKSAVLEAWVDPTAPVQVPTPEELALQATTNNGVQRSAARERSPIKAIGESLLRQFEQLHRHAKYKPLMECVMEDLRKHAKQFRSVAKGERLMFYYNGHGVPRPTLTGDLWVFNRQYTQYIPVGTADLMSWIGTPCIYIWDCSMAMNIVQAFEKNSKARELEIAKIRHVAETIGIKVPISRTAAQGVMEDAIARVTMALASSQTPASGGGGAGGGGGGSFAPQGSQQQVNTTLINLALLPAMHHEDIHFAATRSDELLPTNPELPADLFTACLTTPIKVALRFWVIRNPRSSKVKLEMCEQVPGS